MRNDILHGFWGINSQATDRAPISATTRKNKGNRSLAEVTRAADTVALASRCLLNALQVDEGKAMITQWPEDFQIEPA